jgi:hypothetical protein
MSDPIMTIQIRARSLSKVPLVFNFSLQAPSSVPQPSLDILQGYKGLMSQTDSQIIVS